MSWDLLFQAVKRLDADRADTWLRKQDGWSEDGGVFQHEATGVYFMLDLEPEDDSVALLNLNFIRPSFFAWQTMPLVEAFARDFDLRVIDPQGEGKPVAAEAAALVASWEKGNAWACRAGVGGEVPILPLARSKAMWEWNRAKDGLQEVTAQLAFVPTLMPIRAVKSAHVATCVAWGESIPFLFPPCDHVIIVRERTEGQFENSVMDAADVLSALRRLLKSGPGGMLLDPAAAEKARPIFDGFRGQTFDRFEPLGFDGFIDVEPQDR